MDINVTIENKVASVQGAPVIICGNSDYNITFTFDEEWEPYEAKTARFVYTSGGKLHSTDVLFEGDTVTAPVLSGVSEVFVGVYAGDLHTTTPARIYCKKSILCDNPIHTEPTPDVYNQLLKLLADIAAGSVTAGDITANLEGTAAEAVYGDIEEVTE